MFVNAAAGSAGKAKFCLAPAGLGFGVRVAHCMSDGSIPVVIQVRAGGAPTPPFERTPPLSADAPAR